MRFLSSRPRTLNGISIGAIGLPPDRAFAVAAVLSLALGIGANTAIFQLLDAIEFAHVAGRNSQTNWWRSGFRPGPRAAASSLAGAR